MKYNGGGIISDSMVLTNEGWKYINRIGHNNLILQYDTINKEVSFVKPIRLNTIFDDYIYIFSTPTNEIGFNINRDVYLPIIRNKNGDIEIEQAKTIKYSSHNYIPVAGYKKGNYKFTTEDEFKTFIFSTCDNVIEKENKIFSIINIQSEKHYNWLKKNLLTFGDKNIIFSKDECKIEINEELDPRNLYGQFDYLNISEDWACKFIETFVKYKNSILDRKFKEKGYYLYLNTKNSRDISIIQSFAVLCGMSTSVRYESEIYHLYIWYQDSKKCRSLKKEVIFYQDDFYHLEVQSGFFPIKNLHNICIVGM